jgi:DNA-binding response OmpR family regulator
MGLGLMNILVVEDNAKLGKELMRSFTDRHCNCVLEGTLAGARDQLTANRFDVVVLDLGLPDGEGYELIDFLKDAQIDTPVLILTARSDIADRVRGLRSGADDYMTKPFQIEELMARLEVIVARRQPKRQSLLTIANVQMLLPEEVVHVDGNYISVPRREAALLCILMRRKGRVVLKSAIEEQLFSPDQELGSNAVEVYVHRLRRRLQDNGANVSLHTVRGVGYCLKEDVTSA